MKLHTQKITDILHCNRALNIMKSSCTPFQSTQFFTPSVSSDLSSYWGRVESLRWELISIKPRLFCCLHNSTAQFSTANSLLSPNLFHTLSKYYHPQPTFLFHFLKRASRGADLTDPFLWRPFQPCSRKCILNQLYLFLLRQSRKVAKFPIHSVTVCSQEVVKTLRNAKRTPYFPTPRALLWEEYNPEQDWNCCASCKQN